VGPAGQEVHGPSGRGIRGCCVDVEGLLAVGGEGKGFVVDGQLPDDGMVQPLAAEVRWWTWCSDHQCRNSALMRESSPTSFWVRGSPGFLPASKRRLSTALCLLARLPYQDALRALAGDGLTGLAAPAATALTAVRRRLGERPLELLFWRVTGVLQHPGRCHWLLVCPVPPSLRQQQVRPPPPSPPATTSDGQSSPPGIPMERNHIMPTANSTGTYENDLFDLGAVLVIDAGAASTPRRCATDDGCSPTCASSCASAS
jgi:FxLD family lantipeptide